MTTARTAPPLPRGTGLATAPSGEDARSLDDLETLRRVWQTPTGWRFLTVINNNYIGVMYVAAAFLFFVLAGILALLMRTQLAVPENRVFAPDQYNQFFTMHGTVMMFLFAVPAVEAMGVLLLPNMLGARDLPFPRLSAYAFWAYLIGGLVFFASLFAGIAPSGGWFMNPPLTSAEYSPGIGADLWLLGIGFIEISAIAGAIEIIVGVLRTRAPGMTLARMPIFAWAMLVFAAMIVVAFPAVILATALLELERAFGWPFFVAAKGGDPLLWQHLFWFFGHPEVYIIFLPAAGMVSMIVPAMAGTPLVGHRLVVLALVATAFLSFGLWVHHMFATGIPAVSLSFFQAASMAVAIPAGIQVFAWIATLARGRVLPTTPALFVFGFLFIFVLGGLTGVMVAAVPFDWQAHDTYFVVAHLHYVLIGGMVFPLFAAFYYWMPYTSRYALSERVGRLVFGLLFVGVNVTFFPMHITGLAGMPRRVHTFAADLGWDGLNLTSTIGAYVIAAGVLLFLIDVARRFRVTLEEPAGNVWRAGTLEWLPSGTYGHRSIPVVTGDYPLWDQPGLAVDVAEGRHYLPRSITGGRETLLTSVLDASPQAVLRLPTPAWSPLIAATFTAAFFLLLTIKAIAPAAASGGVAIAAMLRWAWDLDPAPSPRPLGIGHGRQLPDYVSGAASHASWAVMILIIVATALFGSAIFSYLYLWVVAPHMWPTRDALPPVFPAAIGAALLIAGSVAYGFAHRALAAKRSPLVAMIAAVVLGLAGLPVAWFSHHDVSPVDSAYGGMVHALWLLGAVNLAAAVVMTTFAAARRWAGRLDRERRATFDGAHMFWQFAVAQAVLTTALLHGAPRLIGPV